jgi:hypothetical protein
MAFHETSYEAKAVALGSLMEGGSGLSFPGGLSRNNGLADVIGFTWYPFIGFD